MKKKIIAGNWKMYKNLQKAREFVENFKDVLGTAADLKKVDVVICPSFLLIQDIYETLKNSGIKLGSQNIHWEQEGAFTGEVSGLALQSVGAEYTIVGHSERRQHFGETDQMVNARAKAAIKNNLSPIICVGESLEERENLIIKESIGRQVKLALSGISSEDIINAVIAYEPIWAIGTGKTATKVQANEICKFIRDTVSEIYSEKEGEEIRILYGGSMNKTNAKELLNEPDIDGGLIGSASLKAEEFASVIKFII